MTVYESNGSTNGDNSVFFQARAEADAAFKGPFPNDWDFNDRSVFPSLLNALNRTEFETTDAWIRRAFQKRLHIVGDLAPFSRDPDNPSQFSYDADKGKYAVAFELFDWVKQNFPNLDFPEKTSVSFSPSVAERVTARRDAGGFLAPLVAFFDFVDGALALVDLRCVVESEDGSASAISLREELRTAARISVLDYVEKQNGEIAIRGGDRDVETIDIPEQIDGREVTEICFQAFHGAFNLKSVQIPRGVSEIDVSAFSSCNSLKTIEVAPENPNFSSYNGALYNKDGTVLLYCPAKNSEIFKVPARVRKIARYAFADCGNVKALEIFDTVEEISDEAFLGFDYCDSSLEIRRKRRQRVQKGSSKALFLNRIPFRIVRARRRFFCCGRVVKFAKKRRHSFSFVEKSADDVKNVADV